MTDAMLLNQTPPHSSSLEIAVSKLSTDGSLRGRWFGREELISILRRVYDGDPVVAFERIRASAKGTGNLGGTEIRIQGAKRGTKYALGPVFLEHPLTSSGQPSRAVVVRAKAKVKAAEDFPAPASPISEGPIVVYQGDNLDIIRGFPSASFELIYIDPPFNTGRVQSRTRIKTVQDEIGDRTGFQGKRYRTEVIGSSSYSDSFDDYLSFLVPRLEEAFRLLAPTGSFFLHLDYREVHYAKVALDRIFGRQSFINEIIWAYDYGARATNRWSPKHDNILWYAKDPNNYCFNYDEIDRIPYMAPGLVGEEKAARGKTPTDAWWHTIVSPNGKEKTGYPTQKPLGILTRIVKVHSAPGDRVLDFFAGSGSMGEASAVSGRKATLVDESAEAIAVMRRRFSKFKATFVLAHDQLSEATVGDVATVSRGEAHSVCAEQVEESQDPITITPEPPEPRPLVPRRDDDSSRQGRLF